MEQLPERSLANLTLDELMSRCSYAPDCASRTARAWNDQLRERHQRAVNAAIRDGYALRSEVRRNAG